MNTNYYKVEASIMGNWNDAHTNTVAALPRPLTVSISRHSRFLSNRKCDKYERFLTGIRCVLHVVRLLAHIVLLNVAAVMLLRQWFRHNVFIVPSIRVREQFWTRFISQNKSKFKKRYKINVHHSHVRRVASQIHCGDERRFYCVKLAYVVLFFGRTRFRWRVCVNVD